MTITPPKNLPTLKEQDTEKLENLLKELQQTNRRLEKLVQLTSSPPKNRPSEFIISDHILK
jgi:hypothetical protein